VRLRELSLAYVEYRDLETEARENKKQYGDEIAKYLQALGITKTETDVTTIAQQQYSQKYIDKDGIAYLEANYPDVANIIVKARTTERLDVRKK
jgi:hypothetical protein